MAWASIGAIPAALAGLAAGILVGVGACLVVFSYGRPR